MKKRLALALCLCALPASANAGGILAGLEHVFGSSASTIAQHGAKLAGPQKDAWTSVARAFGHLSHRAIAAVNAAGGVPGIDVASYFKFSSAAMLVGASISQLPFGKGLVRWLEAKTEDYANRLSGLAKAIGAGGGVVAQIRTYAHKIFSHVRGILAGTVRATAGVITALVSDFERHFMPLVTRLVRAAKAAPARAKAAVHHFFGSFVKSLLS